MGVVSHYEPLLMWLNLHENRNSLNEKQMVMLKKIYKTLSTMSEKDRNILIEKYFNVKPGTEGHSIRGRYLSDKDLAKKLKLKNEHEFVTQRIKASMSFKKIYEGVSNGD